VVTPLVRKLLRDLRQLRGQAITIALVVAAGIASYLALQTAYRSLEGARDAYYEANRFADVFAQLTRAPWEVRARLEAIPGVAVVETRVADDALVPFDDMPEPAVAHVIGLPSDAQPRLDALTLREGRTFEPGRADEAIVAESFARAHRLSPGSTISIVLEGVLHRVRVVGVALSPEYVFSVGAGEIAQDDRRFGVLWMDGRAIAPAMKLDGAFDDVLVRLQPGASRAAVIEALDVVLKPWGGRGAHGRDRQPSNVMLEGEFAQLGRVATVIPAVFLCVAAFLLNVVLGRLVQLQRGQIATLKAIGYRDREIAIHYLALVTIIVLAGAALGVALGVLLGRGMLSLYAPFYRFPALPHRLDADVLSLAVVASFVAGVLGALATMTRIARLPPAEAMRPEAPAAYERSRLERLGLGRLLGPAAWMVARELARRPVRAGLSIVGIALSVAIIVGARFTNDAIAVLLDVGFESSQHEDLSVTFRDVVPDSAQSELAHLPGVLAVEPERIVPVRIRKGLRSRTLALTARPVAARLRRVVGWPTHEVKLPERGLVLTDTLARILDVVPGEEVEVEVLEGDRRVRTARVAATAPELLGLNAYLALPALHTLLGEQEGISAARLLVDPLEEARFERRARDLPAVGAITRRRRNLELFRAQSAEPLDITTFVLTIFGVIIAIGVVYNDARVVLSVRSHELATMRVLGFSRREVAAVVHGELATCVVLGLAPGLLLGTWLTRLVFAGVTEETFRMPATAFPATYAFAVTVVVAAAIASALLVRRRIARLDLVEVLKARE
jgi:putative ABC transport system permease protein